MNAQSALLSAVVNANIVNRIFKWLSWPTNCTKPDFKSSGYWNIYLINYYLYLKCKEGKKNNWDIPKWTNK